MDKPSLSQQIEKTLNISRIFILIIFLGQCMQMQYLTTLLLFYYYAYFLFNNFIKLYMYKQEKYTDDTHFYAWL